MIRFLINKQVTLRHLSKSKFTTHYSKAQNQLKKVCEKPINHSHIADLRFAYCRLATRILLIFHRIVFPPLPEGAVEPILLNIILAKSKSKR